jgi:hypothetical protein
MNSNETVGGDAQKVFSVDQAELSIYLSDPAKVGIIAMGTVRSAGWTNETLSAWEYIVPPADGIYEFDFLAQPPAETSADVMTDITASTLMEMPENFRGVRIYAETNSKEFLLGSKIDSPVKSSLILKALEEPSGAIEFTVYESGSTGGPETPSETVIDSAIGYRKWRGDIDPGFDPNSNQLEGVDFEHEMLVAIALGDVNPENTIEVTSISVMVGGIMDNVAFVDYTVRHRPSPLPTRETPYMVVKCRSVGYRVIFSRTDA